MRFVLTLALCLLATPLWAGAWMRGEGEGFFSFSTTLSEDRNAPAGTMTTTTLFGEYGVGPGLTLGFSAWATEADQAAYLFLRRPLSQPGAHNHVAVEFALGAFRANGAATDPAARLGLSWGRGVETRWGDGWMQIDASYEHRRHSSTRVLKAEATYGISPSPRAKLIFQAVAEKEGNQKTSVKLTPSYVRRVGETSHILLGIDYGVRNDSTAGIRVGTWFAF